MSPYLYIVRDTKLKKNEIKLASRLDGVDKRLSADKRYRRINGLRGDLFLIYFEYFSSSKAAQVRRRFFLTGPGKDQLRRWLKRWDKPQIAD